MKSAMDSLCTRGNPNCSHHLIMCMYLYMCICVSICVFIFISTQRETYTEREHTCVCFYLHVCIWKVCMCLYMSTHMQNYVYSLCIRTWVNKGFNMHNLVCTSNKGIRVNTFVSLSVSFSFLIYLFPSLSNIRLLLLSALILSSLRFTLLFSSWPKN